MYKKAGLLIRLFFVTLILVSCENKESFMVHNDIGLHDYNEKNLSGKTNINNFNVEYQVSVLENDLHYQVKVKLDDNWLKAVVRYDSESIEFEANNIVLNYDEKLTLINLGEKVSEFLHMKNNNPLEDITMAEVTLISLLQYWSSAPKGYMYQNRKVGDSQSTKGIKSRDEGITCIRKGVRTTSVYDDRNGNTSVRTVTVGTDNCVGRCGPGCGNRFSLSAWGKDCLDHDMCVRQYGEAFNPFAKDCGDEFREAADDYTFGYFRGCRG